MRTCVMTTRASSHGATTKDQTNKIKFVGFVMDYYAKRMLLQANTPHHQVQWPTRCNI